MVIELSPTARALAGCSEDMAGAAKEIPDPFHAAKVVPTVSCRALEAPRPGEVVQTTTESDNHSVAEHADCCALSLTDLISDEETNMLLSLLHQVLLHSKVPKLRPKAVMRRLPVVGDRAGEADVMAGASKEKALLSCAI